MALVTTLLLAGLGAGGYVAYQKLAPYYGRGYVTGRSATIQDVAFTVREARCGVDGSQVAGSRPVKGQYCLVRVDAVSRSGASRYLRLWLFGVELDSGSVAAPATSVMPTQSVKLAPGESRELQLVYDVWQGARMSELKVQVGYDSANIPLL